MSNTLHKRVFKKYDVLLDQSKYEIVIGRDIIASIADHLNTVTSDKRVIIVIDEFFKEKILGPLLEALDGNGYSVHVYNFEAGKQHKNISEALKLYEVLETNNFARDSVMIAIGGGVIGDLAGFVASTFLRGMNLVQVPTTLTGMIDSGIGGKVAINFRKTINAIGNYYHPILNVIDLQFIDTLPERDFKAGLAEIIKCAVICDAELFDYLMTNSKRILGLEEEALLKIFYRAIEIKLDHVTNDVKEQSKRLKLNYGHTLGHAVEISTGVFDEIYRHGEGVSLGMVGASHIAREYYGHGDEIIGRHEEVLKRYGLPVSVETSRFGFEKTELREECLRNIFKDKKRKGNKLRFILPREIGNTEIVNDISDELIENAFHYIIRE